MRSLPSQPASHVKPKTRRRLAFLGGFAVYFSVLWMLWETPLVYPLKIFVVLLHELSHAIAIWATGGSVDRIVLDPLQGGETWGRGGSVFLSLSAGYLGSLLWGTALVTAAHWKKVHAGAISGLIGASVVALSIFYVRSGFGLVFGIIFGISLMASGFRLPDLWNRRVVLVLGMTSCLYAVLDIKSDILDRPHLPSDAAMLAEVTGIPTIFWGVLWIGLALAVCTLLFRWAWRKA
ncbi:MAG: M50 family peptidase [Gemmatimonadetes bacterium]|nr:M50 family peptidase [Gemmatimonadota bacterium]